MGDAEDLYAALLKEDLDLVLSDVWLPRRSGTAMPACVKAAKPELPVPAFSINPVKHSRLQALKEGAWSYLVKGIAATGLLRAVTAVVNDKCEGCKRSQPASA